MAANTGKLAGKVLFITGASRGIGRSIALKAAKDGANVVVAAKTKDPHPKLPGTIYTVAEEIEKAGGKCLPCIVDVRSEEQVQFAVDSVIKTFGRLDILVNNASAISLTGTLDTPMKTYDLMNQINSRGTYLCSKLCLPHLIKSGAGSHILNLSPPLNMNARWFQNHVGYTMAKYGMSMCVKGMSEEFRDKSVAVNALWPKTAIFTAAMKMIGGGDNVSKKCRTPEIMADAAYVIMCQPPSYTGNFLIDEYVLADLAGMKDFDQYACVPGNKKFMIDFFLEPSDLREPTEVPNASTSSSASSSGSESVESTFVKMQSLLSIEAVKSVNASFAFDLSSSDAGYWYLDLKSGSGSAGKLSSAEELSTKDIVMTTSSDDFIKMFNGKLVPTQAFMTGKLKVKGNPMLAMKLESLMMKTQKE